MNAEELLRHYARVADAPNAVGRLRQFVLDLALRGKLVEHDTSDEPATALLKRIATELGQGEKVATPRKAPALALPHGWCWTTLGNFVAHSESGWSPKTLDQPRTGEAWGVLKVSAVSWNEFRPEENKQVLPGTQPRLQAQVRRGDFLISRANTAELVARAVIVEVEPSHLMMSDKIVRLVLAKSCCASYVWLVNNFADFARAHYAQRASGVSPSMKNVTRETILNLPVPLPPLAEQHRIVAKVYELMALCDRLEAARAQREAASDRLAAATLARLNAPDPKTFADDARFALDALPVLTARPDQIKQLRQTILNLAVRGKLVVPDSSDESASSLLARIAADRKRRASTGSGRSRKELPALDIDQAPFELPARWAWARFPELGVFGRGKSKHRPRNDAALFDDGTHLLIQTGDVARSRGIIRTHTGKYNDLGLAQSKKWPSGTLCITIAANIADSGILAFDACFPDSVVGFLPSHLFESARYFEYFVRTAKGNLLEFAPATAQKNINLEILESVLIPLPPLNEQRRIVARVDELMSLCDEVERSLVSTSLHRANLLDVLLHQVLEAADAMEVAA